VNYTASFRFGLSPRGNGFEGVLGVQSFAQGDFYYFGGMKTYWITAIAIFMGLVLKAQTYKEGMIVTSGGDTLNGLVGIGGTANMSFRKEKNSPVQLIPTKDVVAYRYDTATFVRHTFEVLRGNFPEKVNDFLWVALDGPVKLLEYTGKGLFGSEHTNLYLYTEGQVPYRVNTDPGNFRKTMRWYFEEHQELAARIKSKELGYENLKEIVVEFNRWFLEQAALEKSSDQEQEN
jgi:hypothetical protein